MPGPYCNPNRLDQLRLLQREVLVMRSLAHRNIVRYLGAAREGEETIQIFTEWVPGGCIARLLRQFGPLTSKARVLITLTLTADH